MKKMFSGLAIFCLSNGFIYGNLPFEFFPEKLTVKNFEIVDFSKEKDSHKIFLMLEDRLDDFSKGVLLIGTGFDRPEVSNPIASFCGCYEMVLKIDGDNWIISCWQ